MGFDDDLRRALTERAERVTPLTDPMDGIRQRARRIRRRRTAVRVAGSACSVLLVATAIPTVLHKLAEEQPPSVNQFAAASESDVVRLNWKARVSRSAAPERLVSMAHNAMAKELRTQDRSRIEVAPLWSGEYSSTEVRRWVHVVEGWVRQANGVSVARVVACTSPVAGSQQEGTSCFGQPALFQHGNSNEDPATVRHATERISVLTFPLPDQRWVLAVGSPEVGEITYSADRGSLFHGREAGTPTQQGLAVFRRPGTTSAPVELVQAWRSGSSADDQPLTPADRFAEQLAAADRTSPLAAWRLDFVPEARLLR